MWFAFGVVVVSVVLIPTRIARLLFVMQRQSVPRARVFGCCLVRAVVGHGRVASVF